MNKNTTSVILGISLIISIWIINAFIAFIIFSNENWTKEIIISWIIIDILVLVYLNKIKWTNKQVYISSIVFIIILVFFYLIPINNNIPDEAMQLNNQISSKNTDKYIYAEELFYSIENKWRSPVRQYLLEPHKVFFIKDFKYFWNVKGYVDSNIQAQIYRKLLLKSGRFNENEVLLEKSHFCVNSPHSIVVILKDDYKINADLWAVDNFKDYCFGKYTPSPCNYLIGECYE